MKIKINEIFKSIQGEGIYTGIPITFVRTTGCNLRCSWCDTKYAYFRGREMTLDQILDKCRKLGVKNICLTGGEPLMHRDESRELIQLLIKEGFEVLIETNGAFKISGLPKEAVISLDIKCPSSGMSDKMFYENLDLLRTKDWLKFVIDDMKDYNFAKDIVKKYKLESKTNVIFQPVYKENTKFIRSLIKKLLADKLQARIGLQLHRIIWGNKKRRLNQKYERHSKN